MKIYFQLLEEHSKKKKLSSADNKHLHHLIYLSLKRKFYFYNLVFTNSFSAIIVNLYNFIVIFISISYISNSKALITIIFLNLMVYILAYNFFKKSFRFKNNLIIPAKINNPSLIAFTFFFPAILDLS